MFVGIIQRCQHDMVWEGLCTICGIDLKYEKNKTEKYSTYMAIAPNIQMTDQVAKQEGEVLLQKLFKNEKLILILDLDNTVIHSVQVKPNFGAKDIDDENVYDLQMTKREKYVIKVR